MRRSPGRLKLSRHRVMARQEGRRQARGEPGGETRQFLQPEARKGPVAPLREEVNKAS